MDPLKTAEQVKADFKQRGISVSKWALKHGLTRQAVFYVINGKSHGQRGDCHKAAVLLGIKDGEIDDEVWLKTNGPTPEILANEAANPAKREACIV